MNKSWTSCEQVVNKPWTSREKLWTSCEKVINKLWTTSYKSWKSHEIVISSFSERPWTNYEQVINNYIDQPECSSYLFHFDEGGGWESGIGTWEHLSVELAQGKTYLILSYSTLNNSWELLNSAGNARKLVQKYLIIITFQYTIHICHSISY